MPLSTRYPYVPPIARLLKAICDCADSDGVVVVVAWKLAEMIGYPSAESIAPLLAQLVRDDWITYDAQTEEMILLVDPDDEPDLHPDETWGCLRSLPRQI